MVREVCSLWQLTEGSRSRPPGLCAHGAPTLEWHDHGDQMLADRDVRDLDFAVGAMNPWLCMLLPCSSSQRHPGSACQGSRLGVPHSPVCRGQQPGTERSHFLLQEQCDLGWIHVRPVVLHRDALEPPVRVEALRGPECWSGMTIASVGQQLGRRMSEFLLQEPRTRGWICACSVAAQRGTGGLPAGSAGSGSHVLVWSNCDVCRSASREEEVPLIAAGAMLPWKWMS